MVSKHERAAELAPFLYRLRDGWTHLPVFQNITASLPQERLLAALVGGPEDVQVRAALFLADEGVAVQQVPTVNGLRDVSSAYILDMDWGVQAPPDLFQVHPDIPSQKALRLGVRRLSEMLADECAEWLEVTGQPEPLTVRLKNILKEYRIQMYTSMRYYEPSRDGGLH